MNFLSCRKHIISDRLVLFRPTEDDLSAIYEIHADPATNLFNPKGPMQSISTAVELLAHWQSEWDDKGWGYWSIALRSEPERIIGFGGVSNRPRFGGSALVQRLNSQNAANLYFRFRPDTWGLGYANEMAQQALRLAFDEAGLDCVFGIARESNVASRRVLERLGLNFVELSEDESGVDSNAVYSIDARTFSTRLGRLG
ncbi:GNAT family N-acetyltransferase [Solimicrobium silvestre]|uniref:Acetyltransferase including N-acetylases of ribosomal protein n=1 Tax=Solimicrobium silvestre TaxID=2099400 RepID=A0A2S9GYM0_9BURK|nr:GNAT family N-acetyltransferase [Solimicrobium silvestre]PRC92811.1 Acetyltransferase including N-acetylases of ribosomal protein [Solimicrobium silvestre]